MYRVVIYSDGSLNNHQMIVLLIIAGIWAIADAVWQSKMIGTFTYSTVLI